MNDEDEVKGTEVYAHYGQKTCYKYPSEIIALKTLAQSDRMTGVEIKNLSIFKPGDSGYLVEAIGSSIFVEHYKKNATTFHILDVYVVTVDEVYPLTLTGRYPNAQPQFSINKMPK